MSSYVAEKTNGGVGLAAIAAQANGSIEIFISLLAIFQFSFNFGYLFGGKPEAALSGPIFCSGLCSISTPIGSQVQDYLQSGIFR